MRFLFQILAFLVLFYFVRYILRALLPAMFSQPSFDRSEPQSSSRGRAVKQGKMEKDPVCGTYVDVATSLHESFAGQTKYFCSSNCLNKFKQIRYGEGNSKSV